jgi:hypothetical protein
MKSDNNNAGGGGGGGGTLLLEEADQLAKSRNWTRPFALYIMFCKAMAAGDKTKAEACMKLLEPEVMNSLVDPMFKGPEEDKKRNRKKK